MNRFYLSRQNIFKVSLRIKVVNFIRTNSTSVSSVRHHLLLDWWELDFLMLMIKISNDLRVYVHLFLAIRDLLVIIRSYEGDQNFFNFIICISNFISVKPKWNNTRSDDHQTKVQISDSSNDLVSLDIIIWQLLSLPWRRMVVKKSQRRRLIWHIPAGSSFSLRINRVIISPLSSDVKWSMKSD